MKRRVWKTIAAALLLCLCTASCTTTKMRYYYAEASNYIKVTGIVSHMQYDSELDGLYLAFSALSPELDDNNFKIVGENLRIAEANGIYEKIGLGDSVTFATAPRYFGDGYVMPIAAISTSDGEELLTFAEGLPNLLEWLG